MDTVLEIEIEPDLNIIQIKTDTELRRGKSYIYNFILIFFNLTFQIIYQVWGSLINIRSPTFSPLQIYLSGSYCSEVV